MGEPAGNHVGLGKKRDFIAETFLRAAETQEGPGFDNDINEFDEPLEVTNFHQQEAPKRQRTCQGRENEFVATRAHVSFSPSALQPPPPPPARAPPPPPPPPPSAKAEMEEWVEYRDEKGTPYYHNLVTKICSWEKPFPVPPLPPPPPPPPPSAKTETEEWVEYRDDKGNPYYYNLVTNKSTWEKPISLMSSLGVTKHNPSAYAPLRQQQPDSFYPSRIDQRHSWDSVHLTSRDSLTVSYNTQSHILRRQQAQLDRDWEDRFIRERQDAHYRERQERLDRESDFLRAFTH